MTFVYLLLTIIFSVSNSEAGVNIANSINNLLATDMSGLTIWIAGLIIALLAE